jgi:iron complex transport system substrate-binding protein
VNQTRFSRRTTIQGAIAAGLFAALPTIARANQSATPSPQASFPRTITHALGETTIPAAPKTIVAASDFTDLDYLLALDRPPVLFGFTNAWESGFMPWQTAAADLPQFDASGETDLEAIAAAKPDLIVAMASVESIYPQLSAIAPTVVLGWDTEWRAGLRMVAAATGADAAAEDAIAGAEALIAETANQLAPLAERKIMVGFTYGDVFYIWGEKTPTAVLFSELGLTFVPGPEPFLTSASLEQANLLADADILLSVNSDPAGIASQEASPLFSTLPAVQAGRYGVVDIVLARALGDSLSPISLPWGLPQMASLLESLDRGEGKRLA